MHVIYRALSSLVTRLSKAKGFPFPLMSDSYTRRMSLLFIIRSKGYLGRTASAELSSAARNCRVHEQEELTTREKRKDVYLMEK